MVDTSHEWIVQRTGIEERHIAAEGETTSMLGLKAAERALADAKLEPEGHRPHRLRDLDAGLHLPVDGDADPGRAGHPPRRRLRPAGGLHRLRLRRRDGRQVPHLRLAQARPRHRRRDLLAHPRLEGPHHLRAVRRRRRRDRARGPARRGHAAGPRRPDLASALGRRPPRQALRRWRPGLDQDHRLPADGGPRGLPPRRQHGDGRDPRRLQDHRARRRRTSTGSCPHQANKRIIDATAEKLGIAPEKVVLTVNKHGNTSAASIPLALGRSPRRRAHQARATSS